MKIIPTLIFVYNANSGLFNSLSDMAHKILSPETYSCSLCGLTYSHFGMRKEWRQFVGTLGRPVEFLHADELKAAYGIEGAPLPAVFYKKEGGPSLWIDAGAINACQTLRELEQLILDNLSSEPQANPDNGKQKSA